MPRKNLNARYGGGWALITGASDGLGKQYAFQLAKENFNIILMARDRKKLEDVAREIKTSYPSVETHVVVFDFSNLSSEKSVAELEQLLK